MNILFELKLEDSNPLIWRHFSISSQSTFEDLHIAIQIMMRWWNCHLYDFHISNKVIELPDPDPDPDPYFNDSPSYDSQKEILSTHINKKGLKIIYGYDFGDSWRCELTVKGFEDTSKHLSLANCLDGENNGPPEDSGGIYGFHEKMEIIKDPTHEAFQDINNWLNGYDQLAFDIDQINKDLVSPDKYFKKIMASFE